MLKFLPCFNDAIIPFRIGNPFSNQLALLRALHYLTLKLSDKTTFNSKYKSKKKRMSTNLH